jgi:hypothetical protein
MWAVVHASVDDAHLYGGALLVCADTLNMDDAVHAMHVEIAVVGQHCKDAAG